MRNRYTVAPEMEHQKRTRPNGEKIRKKEGAKAKKQEKKDSK
jgi:hypothetical protein